MRIINNPNPIEEKLVVCPECQCEFAYNHNDIHVKSWNNGVLGPGFQASREAWINCPNCGHRIAEE